jgi:hypothetical protein
MGLYPSKSVAIRREADLFEFGDPPAQRSVVKLRPLRNPIWTENKVRLIERYLYYFVLITKHGTYIDGFAGPQYEDRPDAWAARLVLEIEPKWLSRLRKKITVASKLGRALVREPVLLADKVVDWPRFGYRFTS